MARKKVLVVGGAGHFGRLLIDDMSRLTDCDLIAPLRSAADLSNRASLEAALSGVAVAICAAGPFQTLPTTLPELCLQRGIHYIDLADDRQFVRKVRSLVPREGDHLPAICSGWSTVSALSGLLAQIGATGLNEIDAIRIHMAPGNRLPKKTATIASLFHSVGQPFNVFQGGEWHSVYGWSGPGEFVFPPPIGLQRGYLVDVPDHELFPPLFRARTVEFRTGSELKALNAAVSFLSWFVRKGLVRNWAPWSNTFQRAAAVLGFAGHEWGGVGVEVIGSKGRERITRRASVVARFGGQRIAVMPASVMTGLLISGSRHHGVVSPAHWLTREQLADECEKRGFQLTLEET